MRHVKWEILHIPYDIQNATFDIGPLTCDMSQVGIRLLWLQWEYIIEKITPGVLMYPFIHVRFRLYANRFELSYTTTSRRTTWSCCHMALSSRRGQDTIEKDLLADGRLNSLSRNPTQKRGAFAPRE